jgi:hypothetical protein
MPDLPKKEKDNLRLAVVERTSELVLAALSLVAALAWNDAIQTLFKQLFGEAAGLYAKFLYAAFITAIIVVVTLRLTKLTRALQQSLGKDKSA